MLMLLRKLLVRFQRQELIVTIHADEHGVKLSPSNRSEPHSFAWSEVDEIQTFKRDLFTYDHICLAFRIADTWFEVNEEDPGFMALAEKMQQQYPVIPSEWYFEVMQPAFETNQRVLWKRSSSVGISDPQTCVES